MARCQRNNFHTLTAEKRVRANQQRTDPLFSQGRESGIDIGLAASI
jgi:hypothetical protein